MPAETRLRVRTKIQTRRIRVMCHSTNSAQTRPGSSVTLTEGQTLSHLRNSMHTRYKIQLRWALLLLLLSALLRKPALHWHLNLVQERRSLIFLRRVYVVPVNQCLLCSTGGQLQDASNSRPNFVTCVSNIRNSIRSISSGP